MEVIAFAVILQLRGAGTLNGVGIDVDDLGDSIDWN